MNNGRVTRDVSRDEIPEGMNEDAAATWPSEELINSWLGNALDFEMRLGEHTPIPDDPESAARARRFRDVLGLFASGVTVVTSMSDGAPVGMTCQSFSSVSLEPPLVGFCAGKASGSWGRLKGAGQFCVSVLADDQEEVSRRFASKEDDKFAGLAWDRSPLGSPRLTSALAWIDCRTDGVLEGGDHDIVVGAVHDLAVAREGHPLIFFRGGYAHLA